MAALRQSLSSALGASRRSSVASSSSSRILSFSTSASSAAAPRPLATRPRSQIDTEAPRNVHELTERYPNHPLLAFFHREEQEFTAPQTEDESGGKPQTIRKQLPVVLPLGQLKKDSGSRAWLAPELRTKSSLELHQLWYRCLMERNRFVTTRTELERTGAKRILTAWSAPYIDRRIRKTMARIKFVLNERRIALLEAQERALARQAVANAGVDEGDILDADMYEDGADAMRNAATHAA